MKQCSKCECIKVKSDFNKYSRSKDGLYPICRDCKQAIDKAAYANNPNRKAAIQKSNDTRRKLRQAYVRDYLYNHPCVDCGEADIVVLDFDHVRDHKTMNVSQMVMDCHNLETIMAEIAKCEVRCANCHRRATAKRGGWHNASLV